MNRPICVGKKVLVSGPTPFDPQNKIAPFKVAACETTFREYISFRQGSAESFFMLVEINSLGDSVEAMSTDRNYTQSVAAERMKNGGGIKSIEIKEVRKSKWVPLPAHLDYRPANQMKAQEAQEYCKAQLDENGRPGRLPTNAEWEKTARGPKNRLIGTNDGTLKCGTNARCGANDTVVVGSFPAGAYGTYDMVGNAAEWTMEENGDTFIRGALCLGGDFNHCRADSMMKETLTDVSYATVGFRCVWPLGHKK